MELWQQIDNAASTAKELHKLSDRLFKWENGSPLFSRLGNVVRMSDYSKSTILTCSSAEAAERHAAKLNAIACEELRIQIAALEPEVARLFSGLPKIGAKK